MSFFLSSWYLSLYCWSKFSVFVSQSNLLLTNLSSLVVAAFDGHVKDRVWAFGQKYFEYLMWIEIFLRHSFSL